MRIPVLDRYVFREIAFSWAAVTIVLFAIMISHALLRVLVKTAGGKFGVDAVLPLLAATSINLLVTIVPLGLYLGVMLGLGRLYQDSEMVVMSACGVGARRLYRPVMLLGVLGVAITWPLTTVVSPWAEKWEHDIKSATDANRLVALMQQGKFVESQGGDVVLFAQSLSENGEMKNVFMQQKSSDGNLAVENAELARYQVDDESNEQYLVFVNGQRTTVAPGEGDNQIITFAKHGVRIPDTTSESPAARRTSRNTLALWKSDQLADRAEFYWRIGIPFAAPLLAFLALPLAYTSPRKGRYGKIAVAILIYIAYTNLLVLSRKWIAAAQIPEWMGMWWVHLLLFVLALVLLKQIYGVARRPQRKGVVT